MLCVPTARCDHISFRTDNTHTYYTHSLSAIVAQDVTDCGMRPCSESGRRLESTAGGMFDVGWIDVYVSRNLAMYGTRCATLNTTSLAGTSVLMRCLEDGFNSQGRYVYVRSFESARMLRIDGIKVYQKSDYRRLFEEKDDMNSQSTTAHPEERPDEQEGVGRDSLYYELNSKRMKTLAAYMVDLTTAVCNERIRNHSVALDARRAAAVLWAELDDESSIKSCFDCVSMNNSNCETWFSLNYGLSDDTGPNKERLRRLRQSMSEDEPERKKKLDEGLGKSCCRINRKTGVKDCKREYCYDVFKQQAHLRMGHVMRKMHEKGAVDLSIDQRVAVDVLAPHHHSDTRCRSDVPGAKRKDKHITDTECIASSIVSHIAEKHGISKDAVDNELNKYGLSVAKMIAQPFKVAGTASATMSSFKSTPKFADMAAKLKEWRRRADDDSPGGKRRALRQSSHPRGRSLKDARTAVKEASAAAAARAESIGTHDESQPNARRNLPTKQGTKHSVYKNMRNVKKSVGSWAVNVSHFVRDVHNTAERNRASSLMPTVHQPSQVSLSSVMGDTVAAVVSSDGSFVNTVARSAISLGGIMHKGRDLMDKVANAERKRVGNVPASNRRLRESVTESFYSAVDSRLQNHVNTKKPTRAGRRLAAADIGFTAPQKHVDDYGWIAGAADWKRLFSDTHVAARKLVERHDHMLDIVQRTGYLPNGPVLDNHKTGIGFLDMNAPPSTLGNIFRRLHSWVTNKHKSEPNRREHSRRMDESCVTPRKDGINVQHSAFMAALGAITSGGNTFDAVLETMETGNHHTQSNMRKLAESVLGTAANVPLMGARMSNKYSTYEATDGGVQFFRELVRYVVYGACACHMTLKSTTL
mgnify:CR=1 FL=1